MESRPPIYSTATNLKQGYSPPWEDLSIIGIAGSSGSGKTSVAMEVIRSLNLPWVVILVMVRCHVSRFRYWPLLTMPCFRTLFTSLWALRTIKKHIGMNMTLIVPSQLISTS